MKKTYGQVVQALPEARDAQARLAEQMQAHEWYEAHSRDATDYPDLIAALSLQVSDDLCVIQTGGEQRLIAASVCSPSYWNIKEKNRLVPIGCSPTSHVTAAKDRQPNSALHYSGTSDDAL
jgi:hypothetical protein